MRFSVVFSLIDNNIRHHSGHNILTTAMTNTVVDKSTVDNAEPHSICEIDEVALGITKEKG